MRVPTQQPIEYCPFCGSSDVIDHDDETARCEEEDCTIQYSFAVFV